MILPGPIERLAAAGIVLAACGGGGTPPAGATAVDDDPPPVRVAVGLRFVEDIGPEPESVPNTRVVLVRIVEDEGRRTFDLGPFPGVCHHVAAPPPLLARARCGWRGERAGVSLRRLDEAVLVRRLGALGPSFGGNETLLRIPLPEGAALEVVRPPTLPIPGFEPDGARSGAPTAPSSPATKHPSPSGHGSVRAPAAQPSP